MVTIRYKTIEKYECPVCGKETDSAASMCAHIINTSNRFEAHWKWMEAHDISLIDTIGNHKPLIEVVKRKCKRHKCKVKVLTVEGPKPEKNKVVVVKRQKQEEEQGGKL